MLKKCSSGMILRKKYITKKGTKVPVVCIKDRGNPGKGPKIFVIKGKNELKIFGYNTKKNKLSRHRSLNSAMKIYGRSNIIKKLNAVRTLTKNIAPSSSKIFGEDLVWIQSKK